MAVLYLLEQGSTLHKDGEVFSITKQGNIIQKIPAIKVEQVVMLGNINLTTPAIHYLLRQGIDCVFCSNHGKFNGRLISTESGFGVLRQQQVRAADLPGLRLIIARDIVRGKLLNQRTLLMRYQRKVKSDALDEITQKMNGTVKTLDKDDSVETIRGHEGYGSALYYGGFKKLVKYEMGFVNRKRRPPRDPINSMLSFGYTLLVQNIQSVVHTVGLDPFIGFYHVTSYSRPSLVLDLMEEFRPIVVDSIVLWLVNSQTITTDDFQELQDEEEEDKPLLLKENGLKKFIRYYEDRVQSKINYPGVGQVDYRRVFELQARQMVKVILGKEADYKPFLVK